MLANFWERHSVRSWKFAASRLCPLPLSMCMQELNFSDVLIPRAGRHHPLDHVGKQATATLQDRGRGKN